MTSMRISSGIRSRAITMAAALAFTSFTAVAAGAETLADALVSAYRNSNLLEQNRAVLRAADEDVASAVATLRPVVSFIAGVTRVSPAPAFGDSLSATVSLAAEVTLWDFGRSQIGIDIAKETVLSTREALVGVEQEVLLGAVVSFMNVKSASQSVTINQNSVRVIGEELKAAEDRFAVGEVTRTDVALAQARLAAARATLAAAEGDLAAAREAYKAATGNYPGTLAAAPKPPALPKSVEEARAIAQRSHPAVRQAQREVTVAELGVAAAEANFGPTLTANARATLDDNGDDDYAVGLQLTQTLYTGGAKSAAHRRAIAFRDASRSALLQTGVTISEQVGNAWAQIGVSRARIEATDRQIRAATVAYEGVREEAKLGARTTLDVLDAEQDLLDAQADRIDAEASQQIAIYSLLASMGLLTVDHLNLGIPTYDPSIYYNAVRGAPATSVQGQRLDRILKAIGKD
ncbi:TolC family outer membrane protein [Ostreiculturibacter nitratireducens]|uniref:TolC family outer membrane protein n=1 Tax=Ostreiculturibacter nitratireducens TaxID=3075226 RepID=UPI003CCC7417